MASLRRRWYLLIAGLLVTAGLAGFAYVAVPAQYEASASMLLLPPKSSVGARGNPYLYLGGLNQALDVLATRLNAKSVQKPLQAAHPDVTIEVARDATTSGPILVINASGPEPEETLTVVNEVLAQVPTAMGELQDGLQIPTGSRISVMTLSTDTEPEESLKNKLRAVIALGGLGLAGTVVLVGFLDAQLLARKRRRLEQLATVRAHVEGKGGPADRGPKPPSSMGTDDASVGLEPPTGETGRGDVVRQPVGTARPR